MFSFTFWLSGTFRVGRHHLFFAATDGIAVAADDPFSARLIAVFHIESRNNFVSCRQAKISVQLVSRFDRQTVKVRIVLFTQAAEVDGITAWEKWKKVANMQHQIRMKLAFWIEKRRKFPVKF